MLIKDLPVGSIVLMGKNPSLPPNVRKTANPMIWMKANPDCDFICKQEIAGVVFDAQEPENKNKERRLRGNPYYLQSNLFTWLNSDGKNWYRETHDTDAPPCDFDMNRPGATMEEGFLSAFNSAERQCFIPRTYTVLTPKGFKQSFGDKVEIESLVSLPSVSELDFHSGGSDYLEGMPFDTHVTGALFGSRMWTRSTVGNSVVAANAATQKYQGVAPAATLPVHPVIRLDPAGEVERDPSYFNAYCFNPFMSDDGDLSLSKILSFMS